MILCMNQHRQLDQLLPWYQCEALQLGALQGHPWVAAGVVLQMMVAGEASLLTEIVLLHQAPGQGGVEMVIRVVYQGHTVDMVVAPITAEAITVAVTGRTLVMITPDGIQVPRMVIEVGAVSLVLRSRIHLEGRLSLVAGELVALTMEVLGGVLVPREVLRSHRVIMHGLEVEVAVGEVMDVARMVLPHHQAMADKSSCVVMKGGNCGQDYWLFTLWHMEGPCNENFCK